MKPPPPPPPPPAAWAKLKPPPPPLPPAWPKLPPPPPPPCAAWSPAVDQLVVAAGSPLINSGSSACTSGHHLPLLCFQQPSLACSPSSHWHRLLLLAGVCCCWDCRLLCGSSPMATSAGASVPASASPPWPPATWPPALAMSSRIASQHACTPAAEPDTVTGVVEPKSPLGTSILTLCVVRSSLIIAPRLPMIRLT